MKQDLSFRGIKINDKKMIGTLSSFEIIKKLNDTWIPSFQRERILNKNKVESLKRVYNSDGIMDAVKICLSGTYQEIKDNNYELRGDFTIIDGLQRLSALKESEAIGIDIPCELYLNIDGTEQISIFRQFNYKSTRLSQGDLIKSCNGTLGEYNKRVMSEKLLPISFSIRKMQNSMTLSSLVRLEYVLYKRLNEKGDNFIFRPGIDKMLTFLNETLSNIDFINLEKTMKEYLLDYKYRFGDFDANTVAYSRSFFFAWTSLIITKFMNKNGIVNYNKFGSKVGQVITRATKSSKIKELSTAGADVSTMEIYKILIDMFNYGQKTNLLSK